VRLSGHRLTLGVLAWIVFFGGFAMEIGIDYALRIRDGDVRTGGIPETLWFLIQIVLAAVALWLAFRATETLGSWWKRLLIVGLQAAIAFIPYAFIGINYVCGAGIDCF
jgi:hypothetical protein